MRLATAQAVLGVTGTQISTGSTDNANAALDATFPILESVLETKLVRGRCTDYFDLSRYELSSPSFRLEQGFVSKDEPVVVEYLGSVVPETDYELDHATGVLTTLGSFHEGRRVVSVTYSYGFEVDVEDESQLTGVDAALRAAATSLAVSYIMLNPASIAKDKARFTANTSVNGFEMKARQACASFTRPRGTVIWASFSKAVV